MNKINHYIKKIFHRTDYSGLSVFGRGQTFDWKILLTFFLVIIGISLSFSVYVFLGVRAGNIFTDGSKPPVHNETINRDTLDSVIKDFNTRAEKLQTLQAQRPTFVDPSL